MQARRSKLWSRGLTAIAGSFLATAIGVGCLYSSGRPLERLAYDLPFLRRTALDTREGALVFLDEGSAKKLNQPLEGAWDRALHATLLDRLTNDGARLVFYDIVFDAPAPDSAADAAFAGAIERSGRVILGAALDTVEPVGGIKQERILPPLRPLRKAAAAWGLLAVMPLDPDFGVRQIFTGTNDLPSATWRAAEQLGAEITKTPRDPGVTRWVNYYGPPYTFASVSFAQALEPDGVPPGFFRDRIVFVGGRSVISAIGIGKDEFATPYSRSAKNKMSTGLEIHATILLNLLRGEWLTRLHPKAELALIVMVGLLAGMFAWLRPPMAALLAVVAGVALTGTAWWAVWSERVWFNWLIPAIIQLPLGLFWSLAAQYYLEARRQRELRKAFGFYLSPDMASKIADSDFDLRPGGKLVEATIVFTDLENFTALSEDLDPNEVSQTLIAYFEQTTRCILERKGTIIKYVGDAVMAGWGAPIDQPNHAILAAEAACDLRCLAEMEVRGKKLRTRVGLHSGTVLAGNLGSSYRFDYTMIGDTTNFASRLESLNKYLRTQVLISHAARGRIGDGFVFRQAGEFRVAGKAHSVIIHELLCRCGSKAEDVRWVPIFEEGLRLFAAGDLTQARAKMEETSVVRGVPDGPSEFYLRKIKALEANGIPENWDGVVDMAEK